MVRSFFRSGGFYLLIFSLLISLVPLIVTQVISHGRILGEVEKGAEKRIHEMSKTKGHGLGLAFVRETVRAHGGKVQVSSISGEGAQFKISLPLEAKGENP